MSLVLEHPTLLIDDYLAEFDTTRLEHMVVGGETTQAYEVLRDLDMLTIRSPLLDALMWMRGLPAKVTGRKLSPPAGMRVGDLFDEPTAPTLEQPWVGLAEERGRELVFGVVGKFWQPSITWNPIPSDRFASFDEPGWGKIAASISVQPYGQNRTLMTYEARTTMTDPDSRRMFTRYWFLVSPFVGFVMRTLLSDVGRRLKEAN